MGGPRHVAETLRRHSGKYEIGVRKAVNIGNKLDAWRKSHARQMAPVLTLARDRFYLRPIAAPEPNWGIARRSDIGECRPPRARAKNGEPHQALP
jgi:hypothetical protein